LALNEEPREATADAPGATQDDDDSTNPPAEAYERAVRMEATKLKLRDDAKEMLAAIKAGEAPPLGGINLADFLAQPDNPTAYRIDELWPLGGRVLLPAAAKAGKTTMVTNLLKCLADGGDFLGVYETIPVNRHVVYLNMEVGEDQMRSWLRRVKIDNVDRIVVENLRGRASALTLSTEKGRQRVARWLADHDAEIVILDPIAPLLGALGLDENSNSDVATFFSWWSETLHEAKVDDDFLAHHAGWDGSRSRGASRLVDEPDAIWTISRDKATDDDGDDVYGVQEPRYMKAIGRDVELPDRQLIFDAVTGLLTLGNQTRKQAREEAHDAAAEIRVLQRIDEGATSQNDICKGKGYGNEKNNKDALMRLVARGVVIREDLGPGRGFIHYRPGVATVAKVSPATVATGGVASLYEGDTPGTGTRTCEDCGDTLKHQGARICKDCADKRAKGAGL
jgi:hypothetical protein